jgi:Protein of unknown function (DUF3618)
MNDETRDEVSQVRERVQAERVELGRTIEELTSRLDVPARVRGRAQEMVARVRGLGYRTFHNVQIRLHRLAVSLRRTDVSGRHERMAARDRRARMRAGRALAAGPVAKVSPPPRRQR